MSRASAPTLNIRWYDGRLVGRVVTTGPTYFVYADEWLARGHNLSPSAVPFANTAFRQRVDGFDQLPGFLSDCLPDQWGRRIMDREFNALDVRSANADDHGKNHSFLFDDHAGCWTLSPAYDLTLNAESGREYQGLSPNSFGSAPHLATLAGVAADAGVRRDEFDAIDAEVAATIERWPEFAASANLASGVIERVASIHAGLAATLASETPAKRGKRRKLWE